jgi:molybdopterin converting factor small subunit
MNIEVAAFATLRRYMNNLALGSSRIIEVEPGTTLGQIRDILGLPEEEVAIIMHNHRHAELGDVPVDGDRVVYIPPVGGG